MADQMPPAPLVDGDDALSALLEEGVIWGNAFEWLPRLPQGSVDLFFMSPPYADARAYSKISPDRYVEWFLPFAEAMLRATKESGSFVLNIKNRVTKSGPLKGQRHPYVYQLVIALQDMGWRWTETYIWSKPNAIPGRFGPRTKDAFEYVYHFTKGSNPFFDLDAVRVPYRADEAEINRRLKDTNGRRNTDAGFGRESHPDLRPWRGRPRQCDHRGPDLQPAQGPGWTAHRGNARGFGRVLRQGGLPTKWSGHRSVRRVGHDSYRRPPTWPQLRWDRTARRVRSSRQGTLGKRLRPGGVGAAPCR